MSFCRERGILEAQEQATVRQYFRFDPLDSRHPAAQDLEYLVQPFGVLVVEVLNHVREVVTGLGQPFLAPRFGVAACRIRREIGEMPARDELAKSNHAGILREHSKGVDSQHVRSRELARYPRVISLGGVPGDHLTVTPTVLHEVEGPTLAAASGPAQVLAGDHGLPLVFFNFTKLR